MNAVDRELIARIRHDGGWQTGPSSWNVVTDNVPDETILHAAIQSPYGRKMRDEIVDRRVTQMIRIALLGIVGILLIGWFL